MINPCIPEIWDGYAIQYLFMDTQYAIVVQNPDGICKGVREVHFDGQLLQGKEIPLVNDGLAHEVKVILGEKKTS